MSRRTLPQRRAELMANRENDELVTVSGRQPATANVRTQHASTNVRRDHLYQHGRPGSRDPETARDRLQLRGSQVEDWHNGTKPDTTITVSTITELDAFAFFDHVQAIVGPLGGDVIAADLVPSPPPGSCPPANYRRRRP